MARKRGLLEIAAIFFGAVIVLTACRASAGFYYGPPISTVFDVLFYLAILGFLGTVIFGVYRMVMKTEKK